ESGVAGGVRLPVPDVTVELRSQTGGIKVHEAQPVGNTSPHVLRAFDIPVHDDREQPALEMARIVPAFELDLFGELGVLTLRAGGVGVSAVCADEAVHHQLERG